MSGINQFLFASVSRLTACFRDDIGNQKKIVGTGFWLRNDKIPFFVTNKHNVDPSLKLGNETKFKLTSMEIEIRQSGSTVLHPVSFFPVKNIKSSLRIHQTADVAVLINPSIDAPGFAVKCIFTSELASSEFLSEHILAMDVASFIGYPGRVGKPWWDEQWNIPIARTVNIASLPSVPFSNSGIKTSDVTLVSGLSFSGSSGSPILNHAIGFEVVGLEKSGREYVEPKIIGIMSGHWWEQESPDDLFFHSGLSYFTRSTAIIELLPQ